MSLGCDEVKEACTGKRQRSHGPIPTWISRSSRCRPAVATGATGGVDATGHLPNNDRTVNKMRHRSPEAQARNAEMERARKKRLRDGKLKAEAQNDRPAPGHVTSGASAHSALHSTCTVVTCMVWTTLPLPNP